MRDEPLAVGWLIADGYRGERLTVEAAQSSAGFEAWLHLFQQSGRYSGFFQLHRVWPCLAGAGQNRL